MLERSRPDCMAEDRSFIISYCRVVRWSAPDAYRKVSNHWFQAPTAHQRATVASTDLQQELVGRKFITVYFLVTMYISAGLIPNYFLIKDLGMLSRRDTA